MRHAEFVRKHRISSIREVSHTRMAERAHVYAYLMCASGLETYQEQARTRERLKRLVMRDARLSGSTHCPPPVVARMTPDGCVNRSAAGVGMTLHECVIPLVNVTALEG